MNTEPTTGAVPAVPVVIDADLHIYEDPHDLADYADGLLKQSLLAHTASDRWLDTVGFSPQTPYDPPLGDDVGIFPHVVRTKDQLKVDMARLGTDVSIIYTGRLLGTAAQQNAVYPLNISVAYNHYLQDRWLDPASGIHGAIMVAPQAPGESASEIERCAAIPGFAAVYLPMAGVYPLWGHRQYDSIFEAAQAANLPVVLQGYTITRSTFPYQLEQFDTALAKQVIAKPFGAIANLVSMATTGVFARFPRLNVVFAECGISWLPFVLWRLDQQARWLRHDVPLYGSKPSETIRDRVFVTTQLLEEPDDPTVLQALIASIGGPEHVVFATDWPHYDADQVGRIRDADLPLEWKRKILSSSARAIFRL